jgi:predicted aspartyl protease
MRKITNLTLILAGLIACTPQLHAQQAEPDTGLEIAQNALLQEFLIDRTARMTVPVRINNSIAYPFIVDTGSERTVIANDLARLLSLESGGMLKLATVSGPATVGSFLIDNLTTSTLSIDGIEAPGLERANLGAFGLLGIDSLQDNKVYLDLRAGTMQVLPSKRKESRSKFERDMIVVTATRKAGRLILSNAKIDGINVDIIVDTGAQSSMGNYRLRDILSRRNRKGGFAEAEIHTVTGARLIGQSTQIRDIEIGGMHINNLPITFSENYAVKALGLEERPAIFLGMDALNLFDKVAIDFTKKRVSFGLPKGSQLDTSRRLAGL